MNQSVLLGSHNARTICKRLSTVPIKIDVSTTVPVVYPLDYLVVDYPNAELAGHLKHENDNFYFDVPPTIQFKRSDCAVGTNTHPS